MVNEVDNYIDEFLESLPDEFLVDLATYQWGELEKICVALTLDLYFLEHEYISDR